MSGLPYKRLSLITLLMLVLTTSTSAHGYIVRSIPEDRSTLERPPSRLQYWFSEALEPEFSSINLRNDRGDILASGGVSETDRTLLTLTVPQDVGEGAYIVELRPAFASDGHVVGESRVFFVGQEVSGIVGQSASDQALPLEAVWKALLLNTSYVLFGTAMLYSFVLVPVWGSDRYPQGLLPPRVMRRLNLIMFGGIFFAGYANIIALMQQTMVFFGTSLDNVLSGNLWNVVRIGSRFGDVWNFRMVILVLVLVMHSASLYYRQKFPRVVRSFWTANTYLLALLLGAQAVNSHAAGSLVMPWNAILIHWLHALSVAFWVGGVIALTLVLPVALAPYEGETRWQALRPVMRRFSRYVVGAVLLVISSGIYSASNWFFSADDLLSSYGSALGYKLLMGMILLWVGALHHIALNPQWLKRVPLRAWVERARSFGGTMRLETVLAIITVSAAAWLSATPVPEPAFLTENNETLSENRRVGQYEVQMTLAPGAPGINSVDLVVRREVLLVDDVTVNVQLVLPERDQRTDWLEAEHIAEGLYTIVDDSIDRSGRWLALVNIVDSNEQLTRVVFEWSVGDDAGVTTRIPPSWWQLLTAFLTLGAVLYVIYPTGRKVAKRMAWTRTNLLISGGVIVMTAVALIGSTIFLSNQAQRLESELNPLPQQVNTVLPDMGSIALGGGLVQTQCPPAWTDDSMMTLVSARLDSWRDDDLFEITHSGWRNLPSCEETLTRTQRWHIVNYLRHK
ncbi:MAG: copper resistance CopC/CopD family protein [Anaerolineae bacterium]